jgi:hypothetical protein
VDRSSAVRVHTVATAVEPRLAVVETSGRIVRFDVDTSTVGNVGAVEVRVLAP